MARRLLAAGYAVAVRDPSRELVESLLAEGASEAVDAAEVVILSLPTPAIVESVVRELLPAARPGTVIVDMSTGDPATARRCEAACRAAGVGFLDAPVSRGTAGAEAGTLLIMVGGEASVLDQARPVLSQLGSDILHVGGPGSGQVAKLCNNMLAAINTQALGEVLVAGVAAGVDLPTLAGVLTGGTGGSWVLTNQLPRTVFKGDPTSTFALDLMVKDVGLFMRAAEELGLATPLAAVAAQTLRKAQAEGYGPRDYSAMVSYFERLAGIELLPAKEANRG